MTAAGIPALLEPIQNRLEVITPGPWTDWDRGIGHEIHDQYGEPINSGHRETFSARDAEFIANAPTDQARLLAAVQAVTALHKPSKRWEPYEGAGYTFLTREQALEAAGEEDLGVVAIEAGPPFFEVCAECARVESEQLSESGEEWGYREALWPCKTVSAVEAALRAEA